MPGEGDVGARGGAVLLVGMMGAGKTRVGRRLAERLGFEFVDTDEQIERTCGRTIPEIFAHEGESGFRAHERRALAALPDRRAVVALGGGAFASAESRPLLRAKGTVVWLDAAPETLAARIGDSDARPLLAGTRGEARVARLRELGLARADAYARADLRIATDGLDLEQVCAAILAALGREDAA